MRDIAATKRPTEAKLARMEMMNSGMVLKKHTADRNTQPIDFFARISLGVLFKFSQIYIQVSRLYGWKIK